MKQWQIQHNPTISFKSATIEVWPNLKPESDVNSDGLKIKRMRLNEMATGSDDEDHQRRWNANRRGFKSIAYIITNIRNDKSNITHRLLGTPLNTGKYSIAIKQVRPD